MRQVEDNDYQNINVHVYVNISILRISVRNLNSNINTHTRVIETLSQNNFLTISIFLNSKNLSQQTYIKGFQDAFFMWRLNGHSFFGLYLTGTLSFEWMMSEFPKTLYSSVSLLVCISLCLLDQTTNVVQGFTCSVRKLVLQLSFLCVKLVAWAILPFSLALLKSYLEYRHSFVLDKCSISSRL